jgi:membrane fusion protein, copper/silver efflux system
MWKKTLLGCLLLGAGVGIGFQLNTTPDAHHSRSVEATYICPMHPTVISRNPGSCPICAMDLVEAANTNQATANRKIAYWRAPMDPSYTAPEPGKSPMGMDLVPVYQDELGQEGTVLIDPTTIQNIGVSTTVVESRALSRTVRAVGRLDYDETGMSDVNSKTAGWVENLFVDYTGQLVKEGQPLLELYSPNLVNAQEEYLTALDYQRRLQESGSAAAAVGARDLVDAAAQRLRYWDITQFQIDALGASRRVRRTMTLYAPRSGVVVHKAVLDGAHIKVGQHLYRIADLSTVWLHADVYEYELSSIALGQSAVARLSYMPGRVFSGRITYISPFLDPTTRTAQVRLRLSNPDGTLKPGMFANLELDAPLDEETPVLPAQAPIRTGQRAVAIVSLGDGLFQPRQIELGIEANGYVQVLAGLAPGTRVVTAAQFLIDSESNLKAAIHRLTAEANEPASSKQDSSKLDSSKQNSYEQNSEGPDAASNRNQTHQEHGTHEHNAHDHP